MKDPGSYTNPINSSFQKFRTTRLQGENGVMRTKNAKRLWPVPAALAVMAVAAFLAFGLMATNGAQPAAAQDDPDCTVENDANATTGNTPTADTPVIANAIPCSTKNASAVVALEGNPGQEDVDEATVWVYAQDGTITDGSTLTNVWDHDTDEGTAADPADATRFSAIRVKIPEAESADVGGGGAQQQTMNITVTPASGKSDVTLYVYYQSDAPIPTADFDHDNVETTASPDVLQINSPGDGNTSGTLTLTFLGDPAVGKDGADLNNNVDDDVFVQCYANDDTRMKVIVEGDADACPNVSDQTEVDPNPDMMESRSILVAHTAGATSDPEITTVIDGKSKDHQLDATDETEVTVYARIRDAADNNLQGVDVTFSATFMPSADDLKVDFRANSTEDALMVLARGGTAETGKSVLIDNDMEAAGIVVGDAVASRTMTGLPTGKPYRITMEVSADDVPLGSIVITREGTPTVLKAGVFDSECFTLGVADDYAEAKADLEADDCDDSGMGRRFGRGEMVFVKAHLEDALGTVVGTFSDLDSELADDFDESLDADGPVEIDMPVTGKDMPRAWMYMIEDDAMLGVHTITVSTTAKNADDEDIADVMLTVTVAGPPTQYMFVDPVDNIDLGSRAMFTVQAYDAVGGTPHFGTTPATDNMVEVFIQGLPNGNTRNLDATGMLTLNKDTGMGTFTVFAPNTAEDGDTIRIFVASGAMEQQVDVTFGEPGATPDPMERDEFTADYTVTATSTAGSGMVDVSWTRSEELNLSLVSLIQGGEVVDFTITLGISAQFSGVEPGEYDVSVFSFRNNADGKDGEIAFGTVTVE